MAKAYVKGEFSQLRDPEAHIAERMGWPRPVHGLCMARFYGVTTSKRVSLARLGRPCVFHPAEIEQFSLSLSNALWLKGTSHLGWITALDSYASRFEGDHSSSAEMTNTVLGNKHKIT